MDMTAVSKKILESSQDFEKGEREQGQRLGQSPQSFQTAGNLAKKGWGGAACGSGSSSLFQAALSMEGKGGRRCERQEKNPINTYFSTTVLE